MRRLDLAGQRFGRLVALDRAPSRNGHAHWRCACDCGLEKTISATSLANGSSRSCGCGITDSNRRRSVHGMTNTSEHKIWRLMLARCRNANATGYVNYGGRGIKVCARWSAGESGKSGFECFFSDMGSRPSLGHSIDRWPDNDGNYEPGNCRWANRSAQNRNTRRAKVWIIDGKHFETSGDAARHIGVDQSTIVRRAQRGTVLTERK